MKQYAISKEGSEYVVRSDNYVYRSTSIKAVGLELAPYAIENNKDFSVVFGKEVSELERKAIGTIIITGKVRHIMGRNRDGTKTN